MCFIFHENPQLGSHKDYGEGKASPGIGSVSGSLVSAVCVSAAQPQSYRLARAHSERRAYLCICVCLSLIGMGHGGVGGEGVLGGAGRVQMHSQRKHGHWMRNGNTRTGRSDRRRTINVCVGGVCG